MVSANAPLLAQLAVDAVLRVIDPATATSVDLRNIHVVKRLGGAVEDTELVDGLVFPQKSEHTAQGPTRIENARIGLIQFCISPPKTDMECNVVVRVRAAPVSPLACIVLPLQCAVLICWPGG